MSTIFHIVEKNGELEIVHLDPVKIKFNSKTNRDKCIARIPTVNCTCVMCLPIVETNISNTSENTQASAPAKFRVVKNYLKAKRKFMSTEESINASSDEIILNTIQDKVNVEHNGISVENDATISIKTEPELEIKDVDITRNQSEKDIEIEMNAANTVVKDSNAQTKDYKMTKSAADVRTLQFQLKDIKCNICRMVFPANIQQQPAMKNHFQLHKRSIKRSFKCGICHKTLSNMDYLMIIQYKRSNEKNKKNSLLPGNRSGLLRHYSMTSKKLRRYGSVAMKKTHNTTSKVEIFKDETVDSNDHNIEIVDSDDDIQIVEKKPELIVIDDIDDDIIVNKPLTAKNC